MPVVNTFGSVKTVESLLYMYIYQSNLQTVVTPFKSTRLLYQKMNLTTFVPDRLQKLSPRSCHDSSDQSAWMGFNGDRRLSETMLFYWCFQTVRIRSNTDVVSEDVSSGLNSSVHSLTPSERSSAGYDENEFDENRRPRCTGPMFDAGCGS